MARHRAATDPAHMAMGLVEQLQEQLCVVITVIGECEHVLGQWLDTVEEKYPFYCSVCETDRQEGKYPWRLETSIHARIETIVQDIKAGTPHHPAPATEVTDAPVAPAA